jgi:hypothetical protein
MALKTDIRGMVHVYPDYFVVGREKIRGYAAAVKAEDLASFDEKPASELGHSAVVAPLTFTSVFALLVQQDFFRNVDVGIETMHIVQVDSVDERFGADIVVTRNVCTDENGETVLEAFTTLMGQQAENSVRISGL